MKRRLFLPIFIALFILVSTSFGGEDGLRRGFRLLKSQQYPAAVDAFSRVIQSEPENAEAYNQRGVAWAYLGDTERAIADFSRALDIKPDLVGALNNRGSAYHQSGAYDHAIADYTRAIEINPYLAEAYANRATAHAAKKDFFGAIRDYTQAIEINPYVDTSYYNRGKTLAAIGDYPKALADLGRAVELNPKFDDAYHQLAMLRTDCPDPAYRNAEQAVELARRAVELRPLPEHLQTLARAYARMGRWDQAATIQQRAIEMLDQKGDPREVRAYRDRLAEYTGKRPDAPRGEKKAQRVPQPTPESRGAGFCVQAGAFRSRENAERRIAALRKNGYDARMVQFTDARSGIWYTVRIGTYAHRKDAQRHADALARREKLKTGVRPAGSL